MKILVFILFVLSSTYGFAQSYKVSESLKSTPMNASLTTFHNGNYYTVGYQGITVWDKNWNERLIVTIKDDYANRVAVSSNGDIVLLVRRKGKDGKPVHSWYLTKYNSSGVLDKKFGKNGILNLGFNAALETTWIGVREDQKIVVAGWYAFNGSWDSAKDYTFYVFNETGAPEKSFGNNGAVVFDLKLCTHCAGYFPPRLIQNDILLPIAVDGGSRTMAFYKVTSAGKFDSSFGDAGVLAVRSFISWDLTPAKNLLVATGVDKHPQPGYVSFRQFFSNGQADLGFGSQPQGIVNTSVRFSLQSCRYDASSGSCLYRTVKSGRNYVRVSADGNIWFASPVQDRVDSYLEFAKLNSKAQLDLSFENQGIYSLHLSGQGQVDNTSISLLSADRADNILIYAQKNYEIKKVSKH